MMLACIMTEESISFHEHSGKASDIHELVQGYFELIPVPNLGHHCYVNEDGKRLYHEGKLRLNTYATFFLRQHHAIPQDEHIFGNAIFFGTNPPNEAPCTTIFVKEVSDFLRRIATPRTPRN